MRPVLPVWGILVDETKIGFVDQCCGLQCMSGRLAAQVARSKMAKLAVDEWGQPIKRGLATIRPFLQQSSDLMGGRHSREYITDGCAKKKARQSDRFCLSFPNEGMKATEWRK